MQGGWRPCFVVDPPHQSVQGMIMWRILARSCFSGHANVGGTVSRRQCMRCSSSEAPHRVSTRRSPRGAAGIASGTDRDDDVPHGRAEVTASAGQRPSTSPRARRNTKLAAVIREGHSLLQAGSARLQEASSNSKGAVVPRTSHQPLFGDTAALPSRTEVDDDDDEMRKLSVEQIAEGHRLLEVASDVLEAMCRRPSASGGSGLVLSGEPIVLLHVHVHKNLRSAVIYWTLPLPILWDDAVSDDVKFQMVEWFDEQLNAESSPQRQALHELTRRMAATLRSYRFPRIVWKPAPPDMMLAFQEYQKHGDER